MIFVDTGAFIARFITSDQYNASALKIWNKIFNNQDKKIFTSIHIIDETITFLLRKTNFLFAVEKAKILYETEFIKILRTDYDDEISAINLLEKYSEHKLTFTDGLSVVLMRRYNINKIFTYDNDFNIFNFNILR